MSVINAIELEYYIHICEYYIHTYRHICIYHTYMRLTRYVCIYVTYKIYSNMYSV